MSATASPVTPPRPAIADPELVFGAERARPDAPAADAPSVTELAAIPDERLHDLIERARGEHRRASRDATQGRRLFFGAHRQAAMLTWLLWEAMEREVQLAVLYYDHAWQHRANAQETTGERNGAEAVAAHTHEGLCMETCQRAGTIRREIESLR